MAADPRRLKPAETRRLLNSTPLGTVLTERLLRRHRDEAGYRIGDEHTIDLVRYAAWLYEELRWQAPKPDAGDLQGYDAVRERAVQRNKALSLSGRNIGELPEIEQPERKGACARSFRLFAETYFPATFTLGWSADHLRVIERIERCVLEGGLFAMAMPRGSGKSSMCEAACLWAILYGHRSFVVVIGATEEHADNLLDSMKSELEHNDRLLADFPEVCFPLRALEGIYQRANGQLYRGEGTCIGWTAKELVLPTIPESAASGAIIRVVGITGQLRGMKFKRPDGRTARPSLVLIDDPQTDESARSPSQCANRERVLSSAVLGIGGPNVQIAGLMTLTVVRPEDLADQILDRERHPEWQGERTSLVYEFPSNQSKWAEYAGILRRGMGAGEGIAAATAFYKRHRKEMDKGAVVAWEERFKPDELSAIQHAMNLKILDEHAFWSEFQNKPLNESADLAGPLTAAEIAAKTNGMERGLVPAWCEHLTAFIDVQQKMLFYVVAGWSAEFGGAIVDYGTEPDQKDPLFTLRGSRRTLRSRHKGSNPGLEALLYAGLDSLVNRLCGSEWKRDDGTPMRMDRCLIDANWGASTDTVYLFCRQSPLGSLLYPSHGRYVGASSTPFNDYRPKRGDRVGVNWRIPSVRGKRAVRHVVYDTNFWKSFVQERLAVGMGDPGCLSLFGRDARKHQLFAEQMTAEYPVRTEGRGRTVDEWKLKKPGLDNHWLDCAVGAAVAASIQGVSLFGAPDPRQRMRRKIKLSEVQRGGGG
ncbi:MAG: phage terminase large subunit family protein [Planctomycetota bacterium]|nr:phage terminase large subunit family protein [Planctomycetota bacterium]